MAQFKYHLYLTADILFPVLLIHLMYTFIKTPDKDLAGEIVMHGSVNNSHPLPSLLHVHTESRFSKGSTYI